jgi:adenosine deaminase
MPSRELVHRLPKAELHNHLDGSLRPGTLIDLARGAGVALPSSDPDAIARFMRVDHARDLAEFLTRFETTIAVLQDPAAIERVAWEMCEDAARDNVRYLEVRYCPALSTRAGLSLDEVLEAEFRGLARGAQDFRITARVINCALRSQPLEQALDIAQASVRFRDAGVVAFDLAGGEAGRLPSLYGPAFDAALAGRLGITVHAGEAAGPESIADAIDRCHANRLGHGTRLGEDARLRDYVRDRRIAVEVNLTSNVQTRAVSDVGSHPLRTFLDAGLNVTLCTDSWLMCGTTLTQEYLLAHRHLGVTRAEMDRMILNGFESAFLPWPERRHLLDAARDELAAL